MRFLIVEDDEDTGDALGALLELDGHEVAVAKDGRSGIEAARGYGPHVVLCDLGLPGMDGYQVARELRREPDTSSTRLVAVTGYGQEEDRRRSREAGFEIHLTKPVDFRQLQQALSSVAKGRSPQ